MSRANAVGGATTAALVALALAVAACGGEEPPALRVGQLGFSAAALAPLPPSTLPSLGDVAGWGLAVRDGREDSVLAPLARRAAERSRLNTLADALAAEAAGLSEGDLRRAYQQAPEWELRVRHIIRMAPEDAPMTERVRALEEAEEVLRLARAGEDFAALAAEYSEEPGAAERGGLLQPAREGSWVDPFWSAAVALQPGEISPVVETEYGFHVIRLEDRRPVPFAEADRAKLLRRVVSAAEASEAMARWAAEAPDPRPDPAAVSAAHESLRDDRLAPELVIARSGTAAYTGEELAASWAAVAPDERQTLLRDPVRFAGWLQNDVREALWAADAARLGAPVSADAAAGEMALWRAKTAGWTRTFGFAAGMDDERLRSVAIAGTASAGQESRIARQELEGLRPILRRIYPLASPGEPASSASSSEMAKSESTR